MRYCYRNEKNTGMIICCVFAGLLLLFGIILSFKLPFSWDKRNEIPEPFSVEWGASVIKIILVSVFVMWCGRITGKEALNHRIWHKYLIQNGICYKGTITEIIEDSHYVYESGSNLISYQFKISYYNTNTKTYKEFITPVLSFNPDKNANYECDVYETEEIFNDDTDPTSSVIEIRGNKIYFKPNPIKIFNAINKKSKQKWFGNVVADNFHKI